MDEKQHDEKSNLRASSYAFADFENLPSLIYSKVKSREEYVFLNIQTEQTISLVDFDGGCFPPGANLQINFEMSN